MTPIDFKHDFRTVDGVRLHFVTGGDPKGATVVLLAGFPESWYAWRKVMPLLAQHHRVVALDLPGQGDSDKPYTGYDTRTLAVRVHDLLASIDISPYFLVAHGIGAWVAFSYAKMFQQELTGLVLLDAGIPGVTLPDSLPSNPDRSWQTWHFAFHSIPDLPEALIGGKEKVYLEWFLRRKAANPFSFDEADIDEYVRIFQLPGALRAGMAHYRSVTESAEQNRALLKQDKIRVPVLGISADQGSIPDMAGPLMAFADDVKGAVIAQCGHFIPEEQPNALADELLDFFRKIKKEFP